MKKKKESKLSSTSGEEPDEGGETQSELSKQQENIAAKRQRFAHHSSSSEGEVPASPPSGIALSYEMRKNELFKSQERLDEKRCPPPVLPKPKPKPKPKLPPANRNGALQTLPNKKATSPGSQPINSQAMHEIANEISQIKLHNNKKNKLGKSNSSDSDSTDGNVFTKLELKRPKIPKKPFQHAKNVEINETQQAQNTKQFKLPGKSRNVDENSKTSTEEKTNGLLRQNAIYFEEKDGYSKMDNPPDVSKDETSSTPREILHNLKERGTNLMMNKKRVLQNMCWPIGCQNRESYDLEDEDPLYSTVNFATLGYDTGTNADTNMDTPKDTHKDTHKDALKETYKDTAGISVPECSVEAYSNPTYSPSIPNLAISRSPPRTDPSNAIQISPELGIKEVQSIVKGATSYAVGQNRDLYSLPVKERSSSDDTEMVPTSGRSTPEIKTPEHNSPVKNSPVVLTPDDLYSQPIMDSLPDKPEECEGPYAETVLFDQTPTKPLINDTAHPTFDLKPPNFKPPPPPPGGSPILKKKKNKPSPPINRNLKKVRSPKKVPLKDSETLPRDKNLAFKMKRSQSENDLSSETIFATPSSIGIPQEDNNNNRHSMFVTPQEAGKLHEFFVYSDVDVGNENIVHPVHDQFGNGQTQVGNHLDNFGQYKTSFPEIVPPPPFVTPIIDVQSLVVPPPPHLPDNTSLVIRPPSPMYPPPRLCHLEKAVTHKHSDEWQEMVNRLPPPPPDLLES